MRSPEAGVAFVWTPGRLALLSVVLLYVGAFLVLPLWGIVSQLWAAGLTNILGELAKPEALEGMRMTAILAVIALVVNALVGVAGALVLVRQRFWGRRILDAVVDLPLAVSPVMIGLAFILVFGRGGWLQPLLERFGWKVVFSFPGLVLAVLFVTLPFTIREVGNVLEELGTAEEESAATLGASPWQTFWFVTLPNIRDGLSFGVTLTVARALGEFGAVLVLGGAIAGKTQTATTFIYTAMEERWDAGAYGMAFVLALVSMALLAVLEVVKRRRRGV